MRILIDECVHAGVKAAFSGHIVQTVTEIGWNGAKDGPLLAFASTRFDALVTIDRSLEYQHDLAKFTMGFLLVRVPDNRLASYVGLFAQLRDTIESIKPGQIAYVVSPEIRRP